MNDIEQLASDEVLHKFSQFDMRVGRITYYSPTDSPQSLVNVDLGYGKSIVVVQKLSNLYQEEIIDSNVVVITNISTGYG